jgi:spore maturation protein CgeB
MIDETVLLLTFPSKDPFRQIPRVRRFLSRIQFNVSPTGQFDLYYKEPLERVFSKVITYEYTRRIFDVGLSQANREVVELVREGRPKYVIWLSSFYELLPSTFDAIRREGAIVIGWFFDDEVNFETYSTNWIPHLDYFVTNDREAVKKYFDLRAKAFFSLPCMGEAAPQPDAKNKIHDTTFVGRRQPNRDNYFETWRRLGLEVKTFGPGWDSGPVSHERMIEIFRTSKINVNISVAYSSRLGVVRQLKGRPFEVCLAGGFLLTDDAPALAEYFEIGKEIATYAGDADFVEKCRYFLANDAERERIAIRGWQKALTEYSSSKVIGRIIEAIDSDSRRGERTVVAGRESEELPKDASACLLLWATIFLVAGRISLFIDALALWMTHQPLTVMRYAPVLLNRAISNPKH